MADVRSMLNKFEQKDNMSAGRGNKPSVAAKPVLQRFQQPAKEDASSSPANPVFKAGNPPAVKLAGFSGGFPALKPTTTNNNAGDKAGGRRVSVPKAFQNGQDVSNNDDNNNNNNNNNNHTGDQTTAKKGSWQRSKSPTFPSPSSSSSSDHRPPTMPKFPSMSITNQSLTNKQDSDSVVDNSKKPLLPKHFQTKNESIRSTSSTSSSASSSSSSSYKTANFSSPTSPTPKSPPPSQSPTTAGSFDFKSMLRKVDASVAGPPVKKVISDVSNDDPDDPAPKTTVSTSSSNASATSAASSSSNITEKPKTPSRVPPIPSTNDVSMRNSKPDQSMDDIVVRKSDGKRIRRMPIPTHKPPVTPKKPPVPSNIDLTSIRQQYQRLKTGSDVSNGLPVDEDDEDGDVYWDGETTNERTGLPPPTPPQKPVARVDNSSQRISFIPDMTEEEEFALPVYDDTPIEDDIYDDAMSERPGDSNPKTSTSSESPTETEQEKKKRLKEEANAKKKEEKERREKEKKEREEEKKRKKKEEDEMKMRKKFSLTGREKMVGEGVIKQDAKASGLNLKVTKGQIVTIVRLDSNPPNKWLVKFDTQLGYVDSQNIEVDPNIIRKTMTSQSEEDDDQPTYDDVPEEIGSSPIVPVPEDEEDEEEIYEFCE